MEQPEDFISKHILYTQPQIDFLETIDPNISAASRKLTTKCMNNKRREVVEKNLVIFALGCLFIVLSFLMLNQFSYIASTVLGIFFVGYSAIRALRSLPSWNGNQH